MTTVFDLPCITVQQPWAWAIAEAALDPLAKLIENRGRGVRHRGLLGIHAGQRWSQRGEYDQRVQRAWQAAAIADDDMRRGIAPRRSHPLFVFGAIIAVAELVDAHPATGGCCAPWGDSEYRGRVCWYWRFENVRRLAAPVAATGRLGVFRVPVLTAALPLTA